MIRDDDSNVFGGALLTRLNTLVKETSEMPSGGSLSTASDIFQFAEMMRCGGTLHGVRILSPAMVQLATSNHTGLRPNNLMVMARELTGMDEYPAYLGLGSHCAAAGYFSHRSVHWLLHEPSAPWGLDP